MELLVFSFKYFVNFILMLEVTFLNHQIFLSPQLIFSYLKRAIFVIWFLFL